MDFLTTPRRRRLLFAALYLSEGAPIGFIWLALPTRLRVAEIPLPEITWLTAVLVIPWTFKFAWAPLVDILRTRRWTLRHWIVTAQLLMGTTLAPLVWLDLKRDFTVIAGLLVVHALAAATQDVSIDALCIAAADPFERGRLNGWMQAGMLLGRALMGGGALVIGEYIGHAAVIVLLVALTTFSMTLVLMSRLPASAQPTEHVVPRARQVLRTIASALCSRNTWLGLAFAGLGGAAFKSLEVIIGPFLVDRGYLEKEIGWFAAGPMILSMIAGSLIGGWLADRMQRRQFVALALLAFVGCIGALASCDLNAGGTRGGHLLFWLAATAFGIGLFTTASYAMFMDLTQRGIAATQFSAFMGATNGCESWSSYAIGRIVDRADRIVGPVGVGYPIGMLVMCAASLLALPLLVLLRPPDPNRDQLS